MNDLNMSKTALSIRQDSIIQKNRAEKWCGNMQRKTVWPCFFPLKEYSHTYFTCSSLSSLNTKNKNINVKIKSKTLPKYSIKEKNLKSEILVQGPEIKSLI